MPEGHTLRKLADDLTAAFAGRRVRVSSPQGRFAADAEQLDRSLVIGADSAGKHLFLELEDERFVHVHLGLIGQFDVHTGIEGGAAGVPDPVGGAPSSATWSVPPGARRSSAAWGRTRCDPTPTLTWPGGASRRARAPSATS